MEQPSKGTFSTSKTFSRTLTKYSENEVDNSNTYTSYMHLEIETSGHSYRLPLSSSHFLPLYLFRGDLIVHMTSTEHYEGSVNMHMGEDGYKADSRVTTSEITILLMNRNDNRHYKTVNPSYRPLKLNTQALNARNINSRSCKMQKMPAKSYRGLMIFKVSFNKSSITDNTFRSVTAVSDILVLNV